MVLKTTFQKSGKLMLIFPLLDITQFHTPKLLFKLVDYSFLKSCIGLPVIMWNFLNNTVQWECFVFIHKIVVWLEKRKRGGKIKYRELWGN